MKQVCEIDGAHFTPSLHQCSVWRVFKAEATLIREKMKQVCEIDGAHFTPSLHQCSVLRVFKAEATRITRVKPDMENHGP